MTLLRSHEASPPRTLVDVFLTTVADNPDEPALDNGASMLTYADFADEAQAVAASLADVGVGPGDKVGVRISSGTVDLYVAILGVLLAGAAYVPVDADDPDERADLVFGEARVAAVVGNDLTLTVPGPRASGSVVPQAGPGATTAPTEPSLDDDAWVIFTSGSTGTPKGVAVSHRSAAAFVDAEADLFLTDAPIGPGDRVMAGLSVAFDASCEEMWLAWRNGACLVPAPRSLVRSGMDLGPWLVANDITVVSTVPTLVSLWPTDALADVRLLILGGEACPPEIGTRFATEAREVWNTYGPTEATVVACGARVHAGEQVRIGLPLAGWDLAVVDASGVPVGEGEVGELIIGGVGLARYLDPAKDAEKYAPMPTLGWQRAYRSGDLVRNEAAGLIFQGRADDQVKVGGRRIELGEIDSALQALPGVNGAAAAVRATASGTNLLVGYLAVETGFDADAAQASLRADLPAALVPRLAIVPELPTRTSGKVDRDALPWPLPVEDSAEEFTQILSEPQMWLRGEWEDVLGSRVQTLGDDFFSLGGGSLTAAQMVSRLRTRFPEVTVADIYAHPTFGGLALHLDEMAAPTSRLNANVRPVPRKTQRGQLAALVPLRTCHGFALCWYLALACSVGHALGLSFLPAVSAWWLLVWWLAAVSSPGRMLFAALGARVILRGIGPGSYPRGGKVHLRVWLAERLTDELGAGNLGGAALFRWYARLLGATVGRDVDLHAAPPITGHLTMGDGASVEPEVDLTGHWLDGGRLVIGHVTVERQARVGARSTLLPGSVVGEGAEVAPGSTVHGAVPAGERWSGSPASRIGVARGPWEGTRPPRRPIWTWAYGGLAMVIAMLPLLAGALASLALWPAIAGASGLGDLLGRTLLWLPVWTLLALVVLAALVWGLVRLLGLGLAAGHYPVQSRRAWQAWGIVRVLDEARTWLFPLYSSSLTPTWLRLLGADIGKDVEASTVLMIPQLTSVAEGAFLADDTLIGGYELGDGWLRIDHVKVGKHAFVGNSGMAAPGRKVPKRSLVAVLSAAPQRGTARSGSSWIGSPPAKLRRRADKVDATLTYHPSRRLRVLRGVVEACRIVPLWLGAGLVALLATALVGLAGAGWWVAVLLSGVVLSIGGVLGALLATGAKWLLVGRLGPSEHPLWSSFVWRNELADVFVESIAAPLFARPVTGTWLLSAWFRSMGAKIGDGVWVETYWLPELDLIDLRDGVTVNQGCVVQTHLFHDRVLSMDTVLLRAGATLGPNSVILPAASIGRDATVGPGSLVMRGESVPDRTRWVGNPIRPWAPEHDPEGGLV